MGSVTYAVLLAASAVVVAMYAMFASGMFPRAARPVPMRGAAADPLIGVGSAAAVALAATAATGAWLRLEWPYAVIAAGLGLLLGPLAYQALPRPLLDTPLGAGVLGGAAAALLGAWILLAA